MLKSAALGVGFAALLLALSERVGADAGTDLVAAATRVLANANYRCAIYGGAGSGRFAEDGFTLKDGGYTAPPSVPGSAHSVPAARARHTNLIWLARY